MRKDKHKNSEIKQLLMEENIIKGSITFNVNHRMNLIEFAIFGWLVAFNREDIIRVEIRKQLYDILVLNTVKDTKSCIIRGWIVRQQRTEEKGAR